MSNIQKPKYYSNGVELSRVVTNPSIYTNQNNCWEADFSSQFPIVSINQQDGTAILNVGCPHEGYTIETQIKDNRMCEKSFLYSRDNILVAILISKLEKQMDLPDASISVQRKLAPNSRVPNVQRLQLYIVLYNFYF